MLALGREDGKLALVLHPFERSCERAALAAAVDGIHDELPVTQDICERDNEEHDRRHEDKDAQYWRRSRTRPNEQSEHQKLGAGREKVSGPC